MSLAGLMVDDVELGRAATVVDGYGNTVRDWTAATWTTSKAWVAQRSRDEMSDEGRNGEVSEWVITLPAGTDIVADDRVRWDGDEYYVHGKPNPAKTPRGPHHVEADLRLVEG